MADISHVHTYKIDVNEGLQQNAGCVLIGLGDKAADVFKITLVKGGTACADVESAIGYFVRPDGTTVDIEGDIVSNVITLTLDDSCYAHAGNFKFTVTAQSTSGSDDVSVSAVIIEGRVLITRTTTQADPSNIFDINDLWAAINEKVDEPASEGTSGQALLTDGNGGRYWGSAASSGATGSVIVDGDTYSLRTGSTGAAGYLTFVEES